MELSQLLILLKAFSTLKPGSCISFSYPQSSGSHILSGIRNFPCMPITNDSWIKTVLPKTKHRKDIKKREPAAVVGGTASNYEEWIPQHHLKKENTPRKRKSGKVVSPGSTSS
jgi:hypothetical protein